MGKRVTIDLPFGEGFAEVTGYYTPGRAATMYKRNGEPGDPPEPPEFELESIVVGGVDITDTMVLCYKELRSGPMGLTLKYVDWVDWWLEYHWDRVVEQCSEEDYR